MVELALHDLLELELEGLDSTDVGAAIGLLKAMDVQRALVDVGNVIILEVHDLLGVLDDSRRVGGEEELRRHGHAIIGHEGTRLGAVKERLVGGGEQSAGVEKIVLLLEGSILRSGLGGQGVVVIGVLDVNEVDLHAAGGLDADDQGRTLASGDDLVGVVHRLDEQTVGTLKLKDDRLGEVGEANIRVLVVEVLGELGDALGVGLRLELESLGAEESPQLLVVGDDTIVNDGEFPGGVGPVTETPVLAHLNIQKRRKPSHATSLSQGR